MSKPKDNVNNLLAAIKRQSTNATPEKATEEAQPVKKPETKQSARQEAPKAVPSEKKVTRRLGKPVQFWMHDEEIKLVRELSAWLAGQGIRPSDSLVIRSVLRLAKTGSGLLEACSQAAKLDGRLRHD
jgi:hypothetical protein